MRPALGAILAADAALLAAGSPSRSLQISAIERG
jgi:hypothetical protein